MSSAESPNTEQLSARYGMGEAPQANNNVIPLSPETAHHKKSLRALGRFVVDQTFKQNPDSLKLANEEFRDDLAQGATFHKTEELQTEIFEDGVIYRSGFVTKDGFPYYGIVGIPRKQTTEVPAVGTTAWFTRPGGHNERVLRNMMRVGSPVIFVGAEGSYRPKEQPLSEKATTLSRSAAAVLNFARETSLEHPHFLHPTHRTVIGESRGAMVGMGIVALDSKFDQEVIYADLTAPCFPREIQPGDLTDIVKQYSTEPWEVARLVSKLTFRQLLHYPKTFDHKAYSLAHQAAIGRAIFSGEAGELAKLTNPSKVKHISCFNHDTASMISLWQDIFKDHPETQVTPLKGRHLTLADPQTLSYILARNVAFQQAYNTKGTNFSKSDIFKPAHDIASNRMPAG